MVFLGAFLYRASSFLRRVSVSFLLGLLMIVAIDLLHSDGMSSMFGGSDNCSIVVACGMGGVSSRDAGESVGRWNSAFCAGWLGFIIL